MSWTSAAEFLEPLYVGTWRSSYDKYPPYDVTLSPAKLKIKNTIIINYANTIENISEYNWQ